MSAVPSPSPVTLEQAQATLRKAIEAEGMYCPCCGRWCKINAHHLDASRARALLWFRSRHRKSPWQWTRTADEAPRWMVDKNTFSTMKYWGFIEAHPKDPEDTKSKTSGLWRITDSGMNFAEGRTDAPKTAWVFNDVVEKFSEQHVRIRECVGNFNYTEMMNNLFKSAV